MTRLLPRATLAVALVIGLLVLLACAPSQPPLTPEDGAAFRELNAKWCDDVRGTQADGSCSEPQPKGGASTR